MTDYQKIPEKKDEIEKDLDIQEEEVKVELDEETVNKQKAEFANDPELQTGSEGLSTSEFEKRFERDGPNCLPEKKVHPILVFLSYYWGPMPCMIWIAIIIEAIRQDWPDFAVLMILQIVNGLVGYIEEKNAGDAIEALKKNLAPKANVKRNNTWSIIEARNLVKGDRINVKLGDIVPADAILGPGEPLEMDQAALTGESLPVTKFQNDVVYQGSVCKRGEVEAIVCATGEFTFFGKASKLVNSVDSKGNFQKVLLKVTFFLMILSFLLVIGIFIKLMVKKASVLEALSLCVVLLVASIPIAMQVVCTSTMAVGSHQLAVKKAIVSRLSAIEELAGMTVLCSDKTGTLTKNQLTLNDPYLLGKNTYEDILMVSALAAKRIESGQDAIDKCIVDTFKQKSDIDLTKWVEETFIPFDPVRKRVESTVRNTETGETWECTKGAPQVILAMSENLDEIKEDIEREVTSFAKKGYRTLGVAAKKSGDSGWVMMGLLSLYDPPRDDTLRTIKKAKHMEISVKMITGDQIAIAKETCRILDMGDKIYNTEPLVDTGNTTPVMESQLQEMILAADGFAEVFPEHKFFIVEQLQKAGRRCGMTGDGVNDAPALKRADVGIAVEGATDAARAAADIVLTNPGLSVIIDAIFISRKIFQRMKNYITYRIACTIQLLVFFFIAMIAINPRDFADGNAPSSVPEYFSMPVIALVIITVLNDGTILTIAYDRVKVNKHPEVWDLSKVCVVAFILGGVACVSSIILLLVAMDHTTYGHGNVFLQAFDLPRFNYHQIVTLIYLKVSLSDFLTVFAARTHGPFWTRKPAMPLTIAFIFATAVATFFSVYWFIDFKSGKDDVIMKAISWRAAGFVWGYNLVWFFIQDGIKLGVYKVYEQMAIRKYGELQKDVFLGESFLAAGYRDGKFLSKGSFMSARSKQHSVTEKPVDKSHAVNKSKSDISQASH